MDIKTLQSLLRIFFRFETSILLYLQDGGFQGIIVREDIEGLMSDLTLIKNENSIPLTRVNSIDELLDTHQKYAVHIGDSLILPVINEQLDLVGQWNRTDLIKNWDTANNRASRRAFENENYKPSITVTSNTNARKAIANTKNTPRDITNHSSPINVTKKPNLVSVQSKHFKKTSVNHREEETEVKKSSAERVKKELHKPLELSIQALEALPIPMMAVDTKGEILFFNRDWEIMQDKESKLEAVRLMDYAKDEMAKLAFEGKLTIHSTLEFNNLYLGKTIKMKSLLSSRGGTGSTSKSESKRSSEKRPYATGYIFWVASDLGLAAADNSYTVSTNNSNETIAKTTHERNEETDKATDYKPDKATQYDLHHQNNRPPEEYAGRTLNDILANEEKKVLSWAMKKAANNQSNAAALLGIPRQTFAYRYKKYFTD